MTAIDGFKAACKAAIEEAGATTPEQKTGIVVALIGAFGHAMAAEYYPRPAAAAIPALGYGGPVSGGKLVPSNQIG